MNSTWSNEVSIESSPDPDDFISRLKHCICWTVSNMPLVSLTLLGVGPRFDRRYIFLLLCCEPLSEQVHSDFKHINSRLELSTRQFSFELGFLIFAGVVFDRYRLRCFAGKHVAPLFSRHYLIC